MKLWISGEIDLDVSDVYRAARQAVERKVNDCLKQVDLPSKYEKWALIGIVRSEDSPMYDEVVKKQRKVLEFRLKIEHQTFLSGSPEDRERLIINALRRSIEMMDRLEIPKTVQAHLRSCVESASHS